MSLAIVRGVDLFPPPVSWMPPNCVLEVDDVLQEWTWQQPFDLIHMRILEGAFTHEESNRLYKQCYECVDQNSKAEKKNLLIFARSLRPGGWIELLELTLDLQSEDNNWPQDCQLKEWYPLMRSAAEKSGRPLDLYDRCMDLVRDTGFVDIHEEIRKWPIGPWPRDKQLKEIGTVNLEHWLAGLEGYGMYLLTKFGVPKPWSKEEVQVWLAQIRNGLRNTNYHTCHKVLVTVFIYVNPHHANLNPENEYGQGSHSLMRLYSPRWKQSIDFLHQCFHNVGRIYRVPPSSPQNKRSVGGTR